MSSHFNSNIETFPGADQGTEVCDQLFSKMQLDHFEQVKEQGKTTTAEIT